MPVKKKKAAPKKKAKAGRPTKYTPALLKKAEKYLTDFEHHKSVFPSHTGLALYLDIRTSTLYDWAKHDDKKAFSDMLDKIMKIQHDMVMGGALVGEYNSNIAKLILTKHGYHDKQEVTGELAIYKPMIKRFDGSVDTDDA